MSIYLASPYSHPDPLIRRTRFLLAEQCTAALLRQGELVWSPIVHSHSMAERHALPTDAAWWQEWSKDFIRHCEAVYVLRIDGWRESVGVSKEMEFAEICGIPVIFVNEDGVIIIEDAQ